MAKVVYSISRKNWNGKMTGVGDLSDGALRIPRKKGDDLVFEDILKYCHPIPTRPNQFSGYMTSRMRTYLYMTNEKTTTHTLTTWKLNITSGSNT